jgi:hypothetical protein
MFEKKGEDGEMETEVERERRRVECAESADRGAQIERGRKKDRIRDRNRQRGNSNNLLEFYYNTKFKKWKYVFDKNDVDFWNKLEIVGECWEDRVKCDFPTDLNLIPWTNTCTQDLPIIGPNNLNPRTFNYHQYFQEIPCKQLLFNLRKFGKGQQSHISKSFFIPKNPKIHSWPYISSIKLRKSSKPFPTCEPSNELILLIQRLISN